MDLDQNHQGMQEPNAVQRQTNWPVTVLGLESSCDDTATAIVRLHRHGQVEILSDCIHSQDSQHAPFGGVVPEIAARAHVEIMDHLIRQALTEAKLELSELDAVAATSGPGLIGGVLVGMMSAKAIALGSDLPFIAINHLEGHAISPRLDTNIAFPYLLLLVSGGHTQLIEVAAFGQYHRLGSTLDDAAGEAFDKTAKILGLGFPGGPAVEACAKTSDQNRFDLPRTLLRRPGCDFSFSGLKSAVQRVWQGLENPDQQDKADLAASFQRTVADILARQTAKAMQLFTEKHGATHLVVAGGVAANQMIRQRLAALANKEGFAFVAPPLRYCTDNGAMIALAGAEHLIRGQISQLDVAARPRWPLDEGAAQRQPVSGSGKKGPKS